MSFIAMDVKFLETEAPAIARASGAAIDRVIAGHALLWKFCWANKRGEVSRIELAGTFGPEHLDGLIEAAQAFTLTRMGDADRWRVRGAEKYLRIASTRTSAGKKRAASAPRVAGRFTSTPPAHAGDGASKQPALTPSTEHLAPSTEQKGSAPAPRPPRNEDLLCEDFLAAVGAKYAWQGGKDGAALKALLKLGDIDEIRRRWRLGLNAIGWLNTRTVAQLNSKWNDLAGTANVPVGSGDWRSREDHTQDFFKGET